jgi:hypothetical protein
MNVQCPNCRQPVSAVVETVIDVAQDPQAKVRLLSGGVNNVRCPNCGTMVTIAAPLLYHDGSKELLLVYVPMEINLGNDQQERVVGDLMRELTGRLPKEAIRGYIFQPKRVLTLQGLIDSVLQADGVTPEMMEQQRARVRLIESFVAASDEQLAALVAEHDDQIDAQFLQTMTLMAQRMVQEGRTDVAEQVLATQQMVAEHSTFGKQLLEQSQLQEELVREVAGEIQALGAHPTRQSFMELAIRYASDENRLQALVGLVRPAFDEQFFQDLTLGIGQAPADQRDALETMRDRLQQFTAIVDQQTQMAVQHAATFLQELINSPDAETTIRENPELLDDTFMAVLNANIQESQRQGDTRLAGRLRSVYESILKVMRENMQPELRFLNDLLSLPEDEARGLLREQAGNYGAALLEMMDQVERILVSRGDTEILERLAILRQEAEQVLG